MSFELVQFIKIGTRNQSQMYELIIIPENPFSGTHYWCVHNFSAEVIHPNVSDLHILLLLVVLAVHSVVDLKLTWPKCCYTNVKNIKKKLWWQPPSPQHITPSWRKFKLKWYIRMSALSLVFFSRMFLPSTVSSTKNKHVLMLNVESIENFHVNHNHYSISYRRWRKFQLRWYILISATSLVFSSLLSLLSIVMLTNKPHDQKVGKWGIQEKDF